MLYGIANLRAMFERADAVDLAEGQLAYFRYHQMMQRISDHYSKPLPNVVAAFVALSPNSDYVGNLRSLISILEFGEDATVASYGHCKTRALNFLLGYNDFWTSTKGPKTRNFYRNILDPTDHRFVTIDGHVVAAWRASRLTMTQARIAPSTYLLIQRDIQQLAFERFLLPNQYQAALWFARKRTLQIKSERSDQLNLFSLPDDRWNTLRPLQDLPPFKKRDPKTCEPYTSRSITPPTLFAARTLPSIGQIR